MTRHKLLIGDARKILREIRTNSINLIITSPPYWRLKDYGPADQIGFHSTYEEYLSDLRLVFAECLRILKPASVLAINVGDLFIREKIFRVIPLHVDLIRLCIDLNFIHLGSIIWSKIANSPNAAIRPVEQVVIGSYPYPRSGRLIMEHEYICLFHKPGRAILPDSEVKAASRLSKEDWKTYFSSNWKFKGETQKINHPAVFPIELPKRLIRMFSFRAVPELGFEGDWILDPFLGSGTTMLAAIQQERNSIGIELNKAFLPLIKEKIGFKQQRLGSKIIFSEREVA